MPLKDLGDGVSSRRVVGASLEESFHRARAALLDYEARGFSVSFLEEDFPLALLAELSDEQGTRVVASVELLPDGDNTELTLALAGRVFVGGLEGALASSSRVQQEAMRRLDAVLDARLSDLPPRPRRFVPKAAASLEDHATEAGVVEARITEVAPDGETAAAVTPAPSAAPSTPTSPDDERRRQVEEAFRAGLLSEAERDALLSRR